MSGPKTSRYTLTPMQRKLLAEQRKIERRKAVATESMKRNTKRLFQINGSFHAEKQIAAELANRTGSDNGLGAALHELEVLVASIQPIISTTDSDDVSAIEQTAQQVKDCLFEAEKQAKRIEDLSARNEIRLKSDLQAAIDKGFGSSFANVEKAKQATTSVLQDEAVLELERVRRSTVLPQSYLEEIDKALKGMEGISNEVFERNFIALTIKPLVKKSQQFIAEYEMCHEEFEALYAEYAALCNMYYYVAQEYPCSLSSIQTLKAEIERIKEAATEDDEQSYISECLDKVMTEMGYSILGNREVTKRNGKHFRNELYTYGEGTAVNITYSSDGRIAMELGGVDTVDRIPTDQEATQLCASMARFCNDFEEVERRLLTKGVVLADRVALLPPDAAYAQIINTSGYDMEGEIQSLQVKKPRRAIPKPKAMRKE